MTDLAHLAEHVMVVAKAPVPGRVKTRLLPTYSAVEAARLAEAALADTLDAVRRCAVGRRIVALDGPRGTWLGSGFDVVRQVDGPLQVRLAAAWAEAGGPGLQIGMDTPQVTHQLLDLGLSLLREPGTDAVLGPAVDGGWWAIGLREPMPGVFDDVPMSRPDTGRRQLARLRSLGLRTVLLPELADMDRPDDVRRLAVRHPHLRTATVASAMRATTAA